MESCLKCINSACCKLTIDLDRNEYNTIDNYVKSHAIKHSNDFIDKHPSLNIRKNEIDLMYDQLYAYIPKSKEDGLCVLLNRETMLCSVYENRPKVCRDYELNRCENIREICTA